jgi:hypothetical protein
MTLMRLSKLVALSAVGLVLGCGDGTGPGGAGNVRIQFALGPGLGASRSGGSVLGGSAAAQQGVPIDGDNGALDITRIAVVVEEFELEPPEVADCDETPQPPGCVDFETQYFFIDIPVDGSQLTVLDQNAPAGMYEEVEVEIDELEVDEDDADDLANADIIQDLLSDIRSDPDLQDWPDQASMVVMGTFTPKDAQGNLGDPVPFTTFFRAEIEIEYEPPTPFEVSDGNAVTVMVNLQLDLWFRQGNDVLDLAALQSELVELDLEIENGIEVEIDD